MLLPRIGERKEGKDGSVMDKAGIIIQAPRVTVRIVEHDESVTERESWKRKEASVPLAATVKSYRTAKRE